MPSKSKAQHNLMEGVAHSAAFAKKVGIPMSVGKDFVTADKGKKFGSGGQPRLQGINQPKTHHGSQALFKEGGMAKKDMESKAEERKEMKVDEAQDKKLIKKAFGMHDKQEHSGKHTDLSKLKKGGMAMKKYAKGGSIKEERMEPATMANEVEHGKNLSHGEHGEQKRGHTRGKNLGDSGKVLAPKQMAKGGTASSRADGIAQRGKTRGKIC